MTANKNNSSAITKIDHLKKTDILMIRFLICCGLFCMSVFVAWFINPEHIGWKPVYWLLTIALVFKLGKMIHEWYHYWSVSIPVPPVLKTNWTVDVLTTSCPGEPREMVIRTLEAMVKIKYPHTNYLCDEGDDPVLKNICANLGIVHVTRKEKKNAKAGNINNALEQATGDICVVLDPDHCPAEEFLDRVLPYFENEDIGFVQCVQGYCNQSESFIARGAAEQTYHFYGPMMMTMNTYGTVQAIGANCTFRRRALDSIGGHAAGLSEDMHTAMQLHAKGWKSVYIPEVLTRGLVPATLSAYYKQQLKWSRGTFELLFRTYPGLFRKFTWRQKLHYITIPMYFLLGLVNLIDIAIPLLALSLAQVPWEINLGRFALFFLPLCGFSMLIRLYAQRWLLEKSETGFHLAGGLLRVGTWWIFLIGFIYTIFKINVPYIPTPKEDEHRNYIKLSLPNLIAALLCLTAILYGLAIDWTPYSIAMASYCFLNAGILGFIVLVGQQRFLLNVENFIHRIPGAGFLIKIIEKIAIKIQQTIYKVLKNGIVVLLIAASLIFFSYNSNIKETGKPSVLKQKNIGGFYFGLKLSEGDNSLNKIISFENAVHNSCDIVSLDWNWEAQKDVLPEKLMKGIGAHGSIPMICWKPDFKTYPANYKIWRSVKWGIYDTYFKKCAAIFKSYREPVFINFAPGFDNPDNSWSTKGNNTPEEFVEAWQYVYSYFNDLGISNLTWIWSPKNTSSAKYYPGPKFVDWVGVNCLNYGKNLSDRNWVSFAGLYASFKSEFGSLKPVMITELGSATGPDQRQWMDNALKDIRRIFPEIKSIVIRNDKKNLVLLDKQSADTVLRRANFLCGSKEVLKCLSVNFQEEPFINKYSRKAIFKPYQTVANVKYKSGFVRGRPGKFQLLINGRPFYIRGVCYNTGHDWKDGNMPLTRRQLEKDFANIKAMGANTIRRYSFSIYDRNVLNIASEYDLKVMFGFWFDPEVDYYKDTARVRKYINEVENKVKDFKDHPSVLAWSLGNETWGLLKHTYSKPYLTKVRASYIKLIEFLAQRIHQLDPNRPVFSCMEHEEYQLGGELSALHDGAPSVDVIGINSYYKEQISQLKKVTSAFDSLRPYLVSEFGPIGYWDPKYNRTKNGRLIEEKEHEKAEWYKVQWTYYVLANKGYNIGGFAYCWHDRMEGTNTWFGLTDYKARLKPSYYALKELWTNQKEKLLPEFDIRPLGLVNGQQYYYTAISKAEKKRGLNYEWYLHKDDYLERINNLEYTSDGTSVKLIVPEDSCDYRLYLYVSDKLGNVSTASEPVPSRKNFKNKIK